MNKSLEWKDKPVKYLRDKVVEQLKWHFANSHLELDEFEQLVTIALSTQSKAELLSLTADLPPKDDADITSYEPELAAYRDTKTMVSILSESKRTGIWAPPKHLRVVTVLAETELDFREVRLTRDVTDLSVECCMGELRIIVPPGVNLVSNVRNIMASVDNRSQGRMAPDSPTLVIEGWVILGEMRIIVRE